jgi:hypothetical protein
VVTGAPPIIAAFGIRMNETGGAHLAPPRVSTALCSLSVAPYAALPLRLDVVGSPQRQRLNS